MLWFKPSFQKKFNRLPTGWSCSQVWDTLGQPVEAEDTAVPLDSNWGMQPNLTYKVRPGGEVRQWMYEAKGQYYYVWFARAVADQNDPWRVTLKKTAARRL